MEHQILKPNYDADTVRRAALASQLDLAFEMGDTDAIIAARDAFTAEVNRQVNIRLEAGAPIPFTFAEPAQRNSKPTETNEPT